MNIDLTGTSPIDALKLLPRFGFQGHQLFDEDTGELTTLLYVRQWRQVSDKVYVYDESRASAYRAIPLPGDVLPVSAMEREVAARTDLFEKAKGEVVKVVMAVLAWPDPPQWPSHFPSASVPGQAPGQAGY